MKRRTKAERERVEQAERKAAFDWIIAESRRDPAPVPAATPATVGGKVPATDLAAAVAAVLADREAEAEAREAERFLHPQRGGCAFCGLGVSGRAEEHGPTPEWTPVPQGVICCWCRDEVVDRCMLSSEWKLLVARLLLGRGIPMRGIGDPQAFDRLTVWFAETDGTEPVWEIEDRWRHVDRERLAREFDVIATGRDVPVPPVPTVTGPRCDDCGGREYFVEKYPMFEERGTKRVVTRVEEGRGGCVQCWKNWVPA